MEMTTNELGHSILQCAAEVIILQFRKFMGVAAYAWIVFDGDKLLNTNINQRSSDQLRKLIFGDNVYFQSIYYPYAIIDSVWRLLIQSTRIYTEFWYELWGAYIEHIDHNYSTDNFECKISRLKKL